MWVEVAGKESVFKLVRVEVGGHRDRLICDGGDGVQSRTSQEAR